MRDNSSTNGDTQHLSWTVRTLSQSTVAVFHCINKGRWIFRFKIHIIKTTNSIQLQRYADINLIFMHC